jgi:hypothetical protein
MVDEQNIYFQILSTLPVNVVQFLSAIKELGTEHWGIRGEASAQGDSLGFHCRLGQPLGICIPLCT